MKRFLLAGVALLSLGAAASAADLTYEPAPAPMAPVSAPATFDWTGFYAGVHGGGAWGEFNANDFAGNSWSQSAGGALGGVQVGYNYQIDKWVIGVQTDMAYTGISSTTNLYSGIDLNVDMNWFGSTTLRAGYAADTWLFYAKGGLAYGQFQANIDKWIYSDSEWHTGWTVGAGVEKAFTKNVTGFFEYDYADLSGSTYNTSGGSFDGDTNTNILKVGVNYKF